MSRYVCPDGGLRSDYQLVQVTWDDAYVQREEEPIDDGYSYAVTTVGWLIEEGKRHIRLASEVLPDGEFRSVTRIPRSIVLEVRKLRVGS